ncbi:MBL fold metallo-hydrolase [Pseudomonas nitroreducens]|uniref:MBL fold metallo-hydrolase n=1 Tax=Pseudomonas nitroreducens TaxID=46680 RepID=A0A6G6ISF9_PSENT|nr:MBL fold metallo-hydrolase [Pseudomonas nitroreducens]QIE85989.1 MBL fold metallo-hydrolase [Pseudomonas nitroreducens]
MKTDNEKDRQRAAIVYPFDAIPAAGENLEITPGVLWIRMPLPQPLGHINLWAIADGAGWAIVDTGLYTPETEHAWQRLFSGSLANLPITRVLVTHMHPDHIGMAGWLTRQFGCRVWMTQLEYLTARVLATDTGREASMDATEFYRRAGWNETALEQYRVRFGSFGKSVSTLPDSFRRLQDGEHLLIGSHTWQVVVGSGHSPEHACLYCPALRLLISGDQVLPKISSNVSVQPSEPDADPVSDWLASLAKLKREVADDVLVLPAHNEPFQRLHARLDELTSSQLRTLDRLRETLVAPHRVTDLFSTLFSRQVDLDPMLLRLATGETIACLNHLLHNKQVTSHADEQGILWYRLK